MRGALKGCGAVAALRGSPGAPALAAEDAVAIAAAFLASVHVRSLAVTERLLAFQLLLALAQSRPRPGSTLGVALALSVRAQLGFQLLLALAQARPCPRGRRGLAPAAGARRCSSTAGLPAAAAARAGGTIVVADGCLRMSCGRGVQVP